MNKQSLPWVTRDPHEVESLFADFLRKRSRALVNCQLGDGFPGMSATCEIARQTGEAGSRLVLEGFRPTEFVELYAQMGTGKPLTYSFSLEDESKGFILQVEACREGKLFAPVPDRLFDQKRQFFRVEPDPKDPVVIHLLPRSLPTRHIEVKDVSEGGVGLEVPQSILEIGDTCPAVLVLPVHQSPPHMILDQGSVVPVDVTPVTRQLLLGTAGVMFREECPDGSFYYGLSLRLHPADRRHLQHYVYRRQVNIITAMRSLLPSG